MSRDEQQVRVRAVATGLALVAAVCLVPPVEARLFCANSAATLQTALSDARRNGASDEIRIAQGRYTGNFVFSSSEAFDLYLVGGYDRNCLNRGPDPATTVIDGGAQGAALDLNSRAVDTTLVVRGLTIENGLRGLDDGAGIYAKLGDGGTFALEDSIVRGNATSGRGGGLYAKAPRGTVRVSNSSIIGNSSQDKGGGLAVRIDYGLLQIERSFLANNSAARKGGGLSVDADFGVVQVTTSEFVGNLSSDDGGGILIDATYGVAALIDNRLERNMSAQDGGGLYADVPYGELGVMRNDFVGNTAADDGGGLSATAGDETAVFRFTSNLFQANIAEGLGGGIDLDAEGGAAILTNNTAQGNVGRRGGGFEITFGDGEPNAFAYLSNNLLWQNIANSNNNAGGDLWIDNDGDDDLTPTTVVLFSNNFDQTPESGFYSPIPIAIDPSNFNRVDPRFVGGESGSLALMPDSPMINAGKTDAPDLGVSDVAAAPRLIGPAVDVGAYEYLGQTVEALVNCVFDGMPSYYPDVLRPPNQDTSYSAPYYSRSYSESETVLRVSDLDWFSTLVGPDGTVWPVGTLNEWAMYFGCVAP